MTHALDPGARRAILDAVDALRDWSVETLERLVRYPRPSATSNRRWRRWRGSTKG
ncbi:hypothetical protein ACFQU2_07000 [Siccirubricoccus deserti]